MEMDYIYSIMRVLYTKKTFDAYQLQKIMERVNDTPDRK